MTEQNPVMEPFIFPASFAQQRLWFLEQLDPGKSVYHLLYAVRFESSPNISALQRALNELVRRHESLRTSFVMVEGHPMQAVASEKTLDLPSIDLRVLGKLEAEAELKRWAAQEGERPFDLVAGPLLRAHLIHLSNEEDVLVIAMHHIISDGWSLGVFLRELATLYKSFSEGSPSPLPELPIQYADYAVWQREWMQGEALEAQRSYWQKHLEGAPAALELATDRPRPAIQSFAGARKYAELPTSLADRLRDFSRREGVTLFMTLLAAFDVLLWRYSGQDDLVVGTPIAGRPRSELEGLIGLFANTLPLRARLSGNPIFRELLSCVRETALDAYAHQDIPFDKLVEAVQPARSLSHTPLFQVMFGLENTPQALEHNGLTLKWLEVDRGTARSDLSLFVSDKGRELSCVWEYSTDLFDEETIERMVQSYDLILESVLTSPEERIAYLTTLTEKEHHLLLVEWNPQKTGRVTDACVQQLFEAQAKRRPNAIALGCDDQEMTYHQLNARANKLAHHLIKRGVGPEVLVGVCCERSLEMVIGLLGILKAGGAYLPLDPAYPPERLSFMLRHSEARILLTREELFGNLSGHLPPAICLDRDWNLIEVESQENPAYRTSADNLAYVIYTSGSTGEPKGVQISHGALLNLVQWHNSYYEVTSADRATQLAGVSFDASVWELWPYLLAGASVHIPNDETRLTPDLLRDWLLTREITKTFLPTPIAERVLLLSWPTQSKLRIMLTGGDKLSRYPPASLPFLLANNYGPTEATVVATAVFLSELKESDGVPPIGRPISNAEVYLLDSDRQPVPRGVAGELYIGGYGLARGYLQDAALTAQKFVPHVFSAEPGLRLYRTGDLARYRSDGQLEFLGRGDQQVKIRGYRIEPGEVEAVLTQHKAVEESIAVLHEADTGVKQLVAYVVAGKDPTTTIEELRRYLQEKLPDYMVPAAIIMLDVLPLTANGKVDRQALPSPDSLEIARGEKFIAARTAVEGALVEIWSDVLRLDRVGITDNFFELGGDSILIIQIIARANKLGLRLTPKQLFQFQTIAELAAVAETGNFVQAEQGLVTGPVPLTPIQCWFFEHNFPDIHHFNQAMLLEAQDSLDISLLKNALHHLLLHHDALRLRFVRDQSGWKQFIADPDDVVPFVFVDLSQSRGIAQETEMDSAIAELHASLNLSEGPLLRAAFFDLGPDTPARLLLIVHHLAIDGVSWRILLEDLETAYDQLNRRQPVKLPPKTTSVKRWAERLREYVQSGALAQEQDYWLAPASQEINQLPQQHPGGENQQQFAETLSVSLTVAETREILQEVPAAYGTQINEVLLTALARSFAHWSGDLRLRIDLEGHGREEVVEGIDLTRTVGWFTTIFPITIEVQKEAEPGAALLSVKEQLRRIPQRGIGYGLLRYLSEDKDPADRLKALSAPQVSFNYLGQFDQVLSGSTLFRAAPNLAANHSMRHNRSHLLAIEAIIKGGQLRVAWTYCSKIYQRVIVEKLAQYFIRELQSLIAHCRSREAAEYTPSDFPDVELSQEQLDSLLAEIGLS